MATEQCYNTPTSYISNHMTRMRHMVGLKQAEIFKQFAKSIDKRNIKQTMQCSIVKETLRTVKTMGNILSQHEYYRKIDVEPKLYQWSEDGFEDRMTGTALDLQILQSFHPKTLAIYKLLADLTNLKDAIQFLNKASTKEFQEFIRSCKKMLTIYEDINALKAFFIKRLNKIKKKDETFHLYERNQMFKANFKLYETINNYRDTTLVNEPLNLRYMYNDLLIKHEDLKHKWSLAQEGKAQALHEISFKISREQIAMQETLRFYYTQSNIFRENLKYWTWKYERDYEKQTDKVTQKKFTLQALRQQRSDCIERIKMFHMEIADMKERRRLEKLRLAAEAAAEEALLKQMAKQSKGKKKANGNSKKKIKGK